MERLSQIYKIRAIVAELAAANTLLHPVFDRLERELQQAKDGAASPLAIAARRAAETRMLI